MKRFAAYLLALAALAALCAQTAGIRLIDIAESAGLTLPNTAGGLERKTYIVEETGNGVAIIDYDGDGANDVFITNGTTLDPVKGAPPRTSQLYHNDGRGHFTDVSRRAGFATEGWGQGVCAGDYNNDGRTDLLVTYYGHNILYRNAGEGRFQDASAAAGLPTTGIRWGSGCAFLDYDRDGLLDLFVANYVDLDLKTAPRPGSGPHCQWLGLSVACGPLGLPKAFNVLYHNNGDGTFTDVSARAGILKPGSRYGLGVVVSDFDNDGWPDIYVGCDQTPSLFYRNLHNGTFEERGVEAGVAYNANGQVQSGMGVAVADYDNNGFFDIVKTNFSGDLPSLYHNDDGSFFTEVALQVGLGANHLLGWGVVFLDLDEDGWKDLVLANGHFYPEVDRAALGDKYLQKTLLYRNLGTGRFDDITAQAGPALHALRPARGMAIGDLDGDGRPEIIIVNMNQPPSLLRNTAPPGHSIRIRLRGTKSNRSAIGARVELTAGGRTQIDEVRSGSSYYSQNELEIHFGLGSASMIDTLRVRWPSGQWQSWKELPADRPLTLTEQDREVSAGVR